MRLKKLVIIGFKSFADRTVLEFDAGISCIVGPNGCGKSNISDAFRWVLGEQSAKSMRGNKMPDVIFVGTTQRKPLNFAEVSLTLTEVQGALPIDYEEVTITRRLHRSGESEYFLNNNPVRLKDVQNLFLDSGVGRNAFSIFEQGKLDQVISYTPAERRHIFEEAAGINRFLQRKREALKRLEQADQNLSRVKDIHQEVEKQIHLLQIQAKKAIQYKENKLLFEKLEKASYVLRWQTLEQKIATDEEKGLQTDEKLVHIKETYAAWQEKCLAAKLEIHHHEKALRAKSEELYKIRNAQEIQLRDKATLQERLGEVLQKEKKLKRELEELSLARQMRLKELQGIEKKLQEMETEYSDAEKQISSRQERLRQKEKEVAHLRQTWQTQQQAHLKGVQQESQLHHDVKQLEMRLENMADKQQEIEERQRLIIQDLKEGTKQIQDKKNFLQEISGLVEAHKDKLESYEERLKEVVHMTSLKQKAMEQLQRQMMESKARVKVLTRMREDHEGFSSGSKQLLQVAGDSTSPLYDTLKPLYEFLEPELEVAVAVSIILKAYAETLVVDTQAHLLEVIAYATEKGIEDYSLICREQIEQQLGQCKVNKAHKGIYRQVRPHPIAEYFLREVSVAETHEEMVASRQVYCSIGWSGQGGFVDPRGVFFKLKPNSNQVFLREAELKVLEEELLTKEDEQEQLEKELVQQQKRKGEIQQQRAELDQILRRDEMKLVEVNVGLKRALADLDKLQATEKQQARDGVLLAEQKERLSSQLKSLHTNHHTMLQELKKLQQAKEDVQREVEQQEEVLRVLQLDHQEKGKSFQQIHETKRQLQHQKSLLQVKEQDHEVHTQRLGDDLAESVEQQALFETRVEEIQKQLSHLEKEVEITEEACGLAEKEMKAKKGGLQELEQEMARQQEGMRELETEAAQRHVQLAHQQSASLSLVTELQERYQLTMEEARAQVWPIEYSLEQIEKQMRSLRHNLQLSGDINLASIEELEKQQLRYRFLEKQMEDMHASKEELLQIIAELEGTSRKLFKETFEAVRANFKKNFYILFSGGEADLQLTDSEDILEGGIEIIAKPPGKQMRSMSLLSGGEKCLTAVALLFAIFEVKPAPFCILDEIDAPLDDSNVDRFVNVVKHFVNRCQFLIITHNKRTMSIGDVLFGVSMEEKGVSKLLSLEFSQDPIPEVALV